MKIYKKGQKLISLTNDQGLESGKVYTFIGEEIFNLPLMECSSHETKFLKVLDSSGETHIITEKHGLFCDSRDTWSPEARAAALEARRRKARMRAKTPKEIESKSVEEVTTKGKSLSDTQGIYDLNEDRIKHIQRNLDFLYENIYKIPLKEEDFLPGGKYEQASMETLGVKNRKELEEYLEIAPDDVKKLVKSEHSIALRAKANKIDVQNSLYNKLKDDPSFTGLTEPEAREKIRSMIHGWAQTSGDAHKESIATQIVANKVFSIDGQLDHFPLRNEEVFKEAEQLANSEFGEMQAEFLRAQYESTQEYLKKAGIKELVLLRGHKGYKAKGNELSSGHSVDVELQPMSSFSTNHLKAVGFASSDWDKSCIPSLIAVTVKADRILSTPKTGYGCTDEGEVVVLGGKIKATVYSGIDKIRDIKWDYSNISDLLNKVSVKEDK